MMGSFQRIHNKLKSMKSVLKSRAKVEYGELQSKLKVELELHELDLQAESGNIDEDGRTKRRYLR